MSQPSRYWTSSRLRRAAGAALIAVCLSVILTLMFDSNRSSLLNSGDFPGFFVQGEIIKRGEPQRLYDFEYQRSIENHYWPHFSGAFYPAVYPPYTALLLSPLARVGPDAAIRLWLLAALLLTGTALALLRPYSRLGRRAPLTYAAMLLLFAPSFVGVFGGQMTAGVMAVVAGAAAAAYHAPKRGLHWEYLAGALYGILLIKPQYGAPALLLLLIGGYWRAAASGAAIGGTLYLAAVPSFGWLWPEYWLVKLRQFSALNYRSNFHEQVSLPGFFNALSQASAIEVLGIFGWLLVIPVSFLTVSRLRGARVERRQRARQFAALDAFLLLGALIPLISPQTLFYDLGVSALVSLRWISLENDRRVWSAIAVLIAAAAGTLLRESFPVPIMTIWSLCIFIFVLHCSRSSACQAK